jgi:hypothetical protein
MSKTAKLVKHVLVNAKENGILNNSACYKLEPPYKGNSYVVVSEASSDFDLIKFSETMIFASDENGKVSDYTDLHVIYTTSQEKCLRSIGYKITK